MARNAKASTTNNKGNYNKNTPAKSKPVQKQSRDRSVQPERKMSKPTIQSKPIPNTANIQKAKQIQFKIVHKGPIDPSKVHVVVEQLSNLQTLINTYDDVFMDKEVKLTNLIDFIEAKSCKA